MLFMYCIWLVYILYSLQTVLLFPLYIVNSTYIPLYTTEQTCLTNTPNSQRDNTPISHITNKAQKTALLSKQARKQVILGILGRELAVQLIQALHLALTRLDHVLHCARTPRHVLYARRSHHHVILQTDAPEVFEAGLVHGGVDEVAELGLGRGDGIVAEVDAWLHRQHHAFAQGAATSEDWVGEVAFLVWRFACCC